MRKLLFLMAIGALMTAPSAFAQSNTGTTNVTVAVGAEASISVTSSTPLTTADTLFSNFTGSTTFTYKVRTTQVGGSGTVTLEVTSDFSPTGGPSVATSASTGDSLTYACATSGVGTACSTAQTASTAAATNVLTFGANNRSAKAGDSGSVSWTLVNDPQYETGSYTAVATFTIAAV